jgi:hypothetical protein
MGKGSVGWHALIDNVFSSTVKLKAGWGAGVFKMFVVIAFLHGIRAGVANLTKFFLNGGKKWLSPRVSPVETGISHENNNNSLAS